MRQAKKQKSVAHTEGKKGINTNCPRRSPVTRLNKDFKLAIKNMFKELKETMSKELKENVRTKSY